jgi:hypothetical protein
VAKFISKEMPSDKSFTNCHFPRNLSIQVNIFLKIRNLNKGCQSMGAFSGLMAAWVITVFLTSLVEDVVQWVWGR